MVREKYVGGVREPKRRREQCIYCNKLWFVPLWLEVPRAGYICPKCESKRRMEMSKGA